MKIANFWREIASFYLLSEWNKNNQYVLQFFLVLVLFTACLYHFLFWRYFNSSMVSFLSDILLSFPNLNNLNNHVWQKITQNRKSFITQSKHSWWSVLGILQKKKKFNRFYQLFFRTTGLQPKLLILTESPKKGKLGVVFEAKFGPMLWKNKETGNSIEFFWYFAWGIHLQAHTSGYRNTWVKIEG